MAKLRIGIAGFHCESMIASPFLTEASMITLFRGREIIESRLWIVAGAVERLLREADMELVPLVYARAWPGGPIARAAYGAIKAETVAAIAANGPFDGFICANHSAMEVEGLARHGDTDFICALREALGPGVPLAVPFDMHGQLTPELLQAVSVFSVLRTAPHVDAHETGARAAELLLRMIRKGLRPRKACVNVPMLMSGEKSMTLQSPGRELFASLPAFDQRPGLMEANVFIGFGWNDRPWITLQAVAIAESDADAARHAAIDLARDIWERRDDFQLRMRHAELEEGLLQAQAFTGKGPIYLCDSGDNTSAGAGGDLTFALQAALKTPGLTDVAVPGIMAPTVVAKAHAAGLGQSLAVMLGEDHRSAPVQLMQATGVVEALGDGPLPATTVDDFPTEVTQGRWAVIRFGGIRAGFHETRTGIGSPASIAAYGISPTAHRIYVIKVGYLLPDFAKVSGHDILLLTPGCAALDFTRNIYTQVKRPMLPLDQGFDFDPAAHCVMA